MKESEIKNSIGESNSSLTEDNSENISGYRSIFKATSIFGGVQAFNIGISLIRGKVLAVLIGTAGMGLNGLLMSSLNLITQVSGLGLNQSAIRDISAANHSKDTQKIRFVYTVFKRWIWLTAIIGVVLTVSLSPLLSNLAFNDKSHTVVFIFLSITFIFGALTGGIYTLLRGMRKIKDLARANIAGSVAGLLTALPIFYFFGIEGVVPAIIVSGLATYLISIYFRNKVDIKTIPLSLKETFSGGKQMVALGITLTLSSLMGSGIKFILNAYITKVGSLEDLGIFNAGQSIMAGYIGMVFAAMSMDYYPRLSGVINNPREWKNVVNQQAETVLLILGPVLAFILLSAPILIKIILSAEFIPATGYIIWASLAILLRGISWVSGFLIISKGDNKLFLYTEIASLVWSLLLDILFFNLLGTTGLGISLSINYFLAAILMFSVLKKKYNFILSKATYRLTGTYLLLLAAVVSSIVFLDFPRAYFIAGLSFIISLAISIKGLNNRMDLIQIVKKFWNRGN